MIKIEDNKLRKSIELLKQAVEINNPTRLEMDGVVHRFKNAFDFTCLELKNRLKLRSYDNITGPKDIIKKANEAGLIADCRKWLGMLESRKVTIEAYKEDILGKLFTKIKTDYTPLITNSKT